MPLSTSFVAVLDVGHGNSTVIYENGISIIIDCGLGSSLLEFLSQEAIKEVENVFLSHADVDHIGGLVGLISSAEFTVKNVYVNSDGIKPSKIWDDLLYILSHKSLTEEVKLYPAISKSNGNYSCGDIILEPVGPSAYLAAKGPGGLDRMGRKITSNSVSASFRIVWEGIPIIYLAGDIDQIALDDLADHHSDINAQVLVFPHHGGNSGSDILTFADNLLSMADFKTIIFSIGRRKHNNPRPEIVKAIRARGNSARIACTQLSLHCAGLLNGTHPFHLNTAFARGRTSNECCGGTFVINLARDINHSPNIEDHQAFIAAAASSPLCAIG